MARLPLRLLLAVVAALALVAAACSSGTSTAPLARDTGGEEVADPGDGGTTETTDATPSTTAPPTAEPVTTVVDGTVPDGDAKALVTPAGFVLPVLGGGPGAWVVRTPCAREATVAEGTPLTGATVVLDAGHGGIETGSVGPNGLVERDLNLVITEHTRRILEEAGATVVLTRTADYRISLQTRAEIATQLQPKAFVSIHYNGDPDGPSDKPGTETYFQIASPESKRLAGILYEELFNDLARHDVSWTADYDAGAKYRPNREGGDYYGILRRSAGVPAVITEGAFLSEGPEAELLARDDVQRSQAEAIARGIIRFLNTDDPGSGFVEPYPREQPAGSGGGTSNCADPALE